MLIHRNKTTQKLAHTYKSSSSSSSTGVACFFFDAAKEHSMSIMLQDRYELTHSFALLAFLQLPSFLRLSSQEHGPQHLVAYAPRESSATS